MGTGPPLAVGQPAMHASSCRHHLPIATQQNPRRPSWQATLCALWHPPTLGCAGWVCHCRRSGGRAPAAPGPALGLAPPPFTLHVGAAVPAASATLAAAGARRWGGLRLSGKAPPCLGGGPNPKPTAGKVPAGCGACHSATRGAKHVGTTMCGASRGDCKCCRPAGAEGTAPHPSGATANGPGGGGPPTHGPWGGWAHC